MDYDVIVVGGGPAGITAALYLKRGNVKSCLIEKSSLGGVVNKTSIVENYPGVKSISGPDLVFKFYEQVRANEIEQKYEEVLEVKLAGDYRIVKTNKGEYKCRAVILAIGREPKRLDSKNSRGLEGKGISFCSLCDGALYKNCDVAIVGGGNSALEESLYLADICKSVTIINRSAKLTGDEVLKEKVSSRNNINILYNSVVSKFNGDDGVLSSIDVEEDGKLVNLDVKACFIFIGYEPATKFLKSLDILDEKGYINVDAARRSTIKGIYAAGDIVKKEAYQIVTACSDGAIAAVSCMKDLSM